MQTAVGYSLSGSTREEKLFFVHGDTATGKSTFIEAIKATFGEYAVTADFEAFLRRKEVGSIRNDIARLRGARFVASIEVDQGKALAEGLVKMLTGGDTVSARFLYNESFEFVPQFKLWLAANHAPRVRDDDAAIWRRIIRVPFDHRIPENEQNPEIKATLRNPEIAGPAILAWAMKGCLTWQKEGLSIPDIIRESTAEYRQSQNPLAEFFEDICQFGPSASVPVRDLRAAYEAWAKENGQHFPLSLREFNKRLQAKGCNQQTRRCLNEIGTERFVRTWVGISLQDKPTFEEIEDEIPI